MMTEFVNSQRISLVDFSMLTTSTEKICQEAFLYNKFAIGALTRRCPFFHINYR
jgi:hypothetical protein